MMDVIRNVARKIDQGERLSDEDALALFNSNELVEIGRLADGVNRAKNKDLVFYNVNRHINPTNICALSCKFCAYSRKPGEEGAYAYSIEEMVTKAGEAVAQGATEVHMVGGLHPRWKFEHYKDMIAAVKQAFPHVHIKAFTAVELDWLARRARKTIEEILRELQAVGLGSLPGGGAEIFHPEIRETICDTKVPAEQWLNTHRIAHSLGMHSNCTMLYGHIENYAHRVDHMRRLRELQDETGGFNAFIPLSFQPFQNEMGINNYTFGYDDLKTLAIARLYLDNFRHVKAYWIMLGQEVAQLGLEFGANDLDGTVIEEKISRMAGGRAGMAMSRNFIEHLILKSRRIPCERDTLYRPIKQPELRPKAEPSANLRQAINKCDYGEQLTLEELQLLADQASLHEVGRLAAAICGQTATVGEGSFAPTTVLKLAEVSSVEEALSTLDAVAERNCSKFKLAASTIAIDLAPSSTPVGGEPTASLGLDALLTIATNCRERFPTQEVAVWGTKGLWRLAQSQQISVAKLAERLAAAGVQSFGSSPDESETDLTNQEITELHSVMHAAGIHTIAKVELTAPTYGPSEPQWSAFLRRVKALADLQARTGNIVGIEVTASPGSFITTSEYFRAIALARLGSHGIPLVIAPLTMIPTLSQPKGLGTASYQHPAEKIGSVCLHFGAADLGSLDMQKLSPISIMEQIRAAGFKPTLRAANQQQPSLEVYSAIEQGLRHAPSLGL